MNPELRQTLQSISRNLESANETAQENIYGFTQQYVDPCLGGFRSCLYECTAPCLGGGRADQLRRKRGRSRGRPELNFDFYDDWDEDADATNSLIGWGDDELDSLLAQGSRSGGDRGSGEPRKQAGMSYGSGGKAKRSPAHDPTEEDPTVIPSSSYLGFLERLPFKFGGKLRYKPSAADLQENPGGLKVADFGGNTLPEECEDEEPALLSKGRLRSGTAASRSTVNSLSSRGDLIPSDEEADAVPLDDEFAVALERRTTTTTEDQQSGKSRTGKKSRVSGASTRTVSSLSTKNSGNGGRVSSTSSMKERGLVQLSPLGPPQDLVGGISARQGGERDEVVIDGVASTNISDRGLSSDDENQGIELNIASITRVESSKKAAESPKPSTEPEGS